MRKTFILHLIIYTLFSSGLFCQNLLLNIYSNDNIETTIIDSLNYIKTHHNYLSIKDEVDLLQNNLYRIGYIENELKNISTDNDSVFSVEIHLKKKISNISIYYDQSEINQKLINTISEKVSDDYFTIPFAEIGNTLIFINSRIAEKGLPFSKLHLTNVMPLDENNLKATLVIEITKQKRVINNIIIKGYEKFPRSYLKHYLKIKPNQIFNLSSIKNKTEQLNNLKFASEVKPPEVLFSKDSTTLYLYVQKTNSNSFDGFLGFGTNEDTNKLQFDGYLNLTLANNLNYGETFSLLYKSDENDQKTFETNLSLPYLLKSPLGLDFALRIFKKDSSFSTINQSAKIHFQINAKHKIYSGISSIQSNNLLNEATTSNIFNYKTNYFSFAYQFLNNQTSNSLFPINSHFYFETNFGKRNQLSLQEKQSLLNVDASKIFNLDDRNSIYLRTNGSLLNSNTYVENELIRFGGINSIRGFEENSIYATLLGLLNTEYRIQLNNSIYIHSITDLAYFQNKISDTEEKLVAIGFGFGILTKTGLLKFNYANGTIENTPFKISNSKIHLSLIANF